MPTTHCPYPSVEELTKTFDMSPHPEGGFFKETYRWSEHLSFSQQQSRKPWSRHLSFHPGTLENSARLHCQIVSKATATTQQQFCSCSRWATIRISTEWQHLRFIPPTLHSSASRLSCMSLSTNACLTYCSLGGSPLHHCRQRILSSCVLQPPLLILDSCLISLEAD